MRRDSEQRGPPARTLSVYSDVVKDGGYPVMSYLVLDDENCVRGVGTRPVPTLSGVNSARRLALREGLTAAAACATPRELTIFNGNVRHSGLVIGRMSADIQQWASDIDTISLERGSGAVNSLVTDFGRQVMRQPFSSKFTMPSGSVQNPVRVYVDGSHRDEEPSTAIGYAIVDAAGQVITLRAAPFTPPTSALKAEYRALRVALRHATRLSDVTDIHALTDNMNVLDTAAMDHMEPDDSVPAPSRVEEDAQHIRRLRQEFDGFRIEHVPRSKNRLADALAWCGHSNPIDGIR